jgi:RNA polymerase sigma factor (sigma-70 family)
MPKTVVMFLRPVGKLFLESFEMVVNAAGLRTSSAPMVEKDHLLKLLIAFQHTNGPVGRLRLAEEIFSVIEPDLRSFVFSHVRQNAGDDVLQEVLKAIATSLGKFTGHSAGEFWAWCYRIARNKLNDQFRRQFNDRSQPMPPEEILQLAETTTHSASFTAADRHDLDFAMKLLIKSKPDCYDFLWKHFVFGLNYDEIATELKLNYDQVRMKIGRCLETAKALMA